MSRLLLDEQPLLVMPKLATVIGLNEALLLQQIHYWNEINKKTKNNFRDGHYWTFNSYENWEKQFPFWSTSTIKRTMAKLEKMNLVIVGNYNKLKIDRTKWYRIDYNEVEKLDKMPLCQNDPIKVSKRPNQKSKMSRPLPETNSKTNAEINVLQNYFPSNFDMYENNTSVKILGCYCYLTFGRKLRENQSGASLSEYKYLTEHQFIDFLFENIKDYDHCNVDYLNSIAGRLI